MNISYEDIDKILYALCYANAMLDVKIEELHKKRIQGVCNRIPLKKRRGVKSNQRLTKDKKRTTSKR